jgi:cobalt-zinc-cadmium efflux system outer membrane protein
MSPSAFAAVLATAIVAGNASAQDVPESLVAEALARNPDLLAAREDLGALRQRPAAARGLPDPWLSAEYQNDGWAPSLGDEDMTMLTVMAGQLLPLGGKRQLRADILSLDADQAAQQVARLELSLGASVRRGYEQLRLTRRSVAVLREQQTTWQGVRDAAEARYSAGQGQQQDLFRAEIERLLAEQQLSALQAEETSLLLDLNRLRDAPPDAPLVTDIPLSVGEPPAEIPELRSLAVGVEKARAALALARAQSKPDVTVQAGYSNRGDLPPMWQAGASINLPIRRRRLAAGVAEAEAQLRAAESRRASVERLIAARARDRANRLSSAETVARLYAEGLVPQANAAVDATLAAYGTGRATLAQVLEAMATVRATRLAELRAVAAANVIRIAIAEASLESTPVTLSVETGAMRMSSGTGATPNAAAMEMR